MGRGRRRLGAQFDVFARGGIIHLAKAGMRPSRIAKLIKKTNGKLGKVDAVRKTTRKHNDSKGKWRGQRKPSSGALSKFSQKENHRIVRLVFERRRERCRYFCLHPAIDSSLAASRGGGRGRGGGWGVYPLAQYRVGALGAL